MPELSVAVTGANGYLGTALCAACQKAGARLHPLVRSGPVPYALDAPPPPEFFRRNGVTALLHAAWDLSAVDDDESRRRNVEGSLRLFESARAGGVGRIVFISSLAAYDGAASRYGREKREVEKAVLSLGGAALRPGTVFGPRPGGILGAVLRQVRSRTWLPVIRHPGALYLAHEDDVARATVEAALGKEAPGRPVFAAHEKKWTLEEIARTLAKSAGRKIRPIAVPWRIPWSVLRLAETLGHRPAFRSDSVLSLGQPAPEEEPSRLARPSFPFRPFTAESVENLLPSAADKR